MTASSPAPSGSRRWVFWIFLALAPDVNDAGATRIDRGGGTSIWTVAIDEERELAESALAWL